MTHEETKKILRIIVATYPTFHPEDMKETIDTWEMLLDEYSYMDIAVAFKTYTRLNTTSYAPNLNQLINYVHKAEEQNETSDGEAWAMVRKAISRANYYAQEEFDNFPETVKKAVGSPSNLRQWAMDENFNEGVVQSNFLRSYRTQCERKREFERMPSEMQQRIIELGATTSKKLIGGQNDTTCN